MPAKRLTSARSSSAVHTPADIVRHADELVQRRIQPVRVAGQPVADERKQLAQLHRIASIKTLKTTDPRLLHHDSRA
jgi:hypothetical protein